MTEEQWKDVASKLVAVVDRNLNGWQRQFSQEQLRALGELEGDETIFNRGGRWDDDNRSIWD